jgi:hypothetical protein
MILCPKETASAGLRPLVEAGTAEKDFGRLSPRKIESAQNVNKQQLIFFDKTKTKQKKILKLPRGTNTKLTIPKTNFNMILTTLNVSRIMARSSVVKKAPFEFGVKKIHTTAAIKNTSANDSAEKQDLIVDYLDGDRSGIVVFGLNRPQAKNSFSKNLVGQLIEAVEAVRFDKGARVVVIKSTTPGIFCAGADLKERVKMPASSVGPFIAKARRLLSDLENLPMPVIAAIDGHALGIQQNILSGGHRRQSYYQLFFQKVADSKWHWHVI